MPPWIESVLARARDLAQQASAVAARRVWPTLCRWRDLAQPWLRDPRVRVVAVVLGIGLLLAPGVAYFRQEAPAPPAAEAAARARAPLASDAQTALAPDAAPAATTGDWFEDQPAPSAGDPGGADAASYECLLEPSDTISIGSPVTGRIEAIPVERTQLVERDQVVVQLESTVESAALDVAQARAIADGSVRSRLANAELENQRKERAKHLFEKRTMSLDLRQEIETQARVAEAELWRAREERHLAALELEQARAALERRTIRTPIPGIVVERLMSPGEVVDEKTILRIARIDPLRVEAMLPAAEFGQVAVGMRAAVTPEVPGDQVHTAQVVMVDRVVDPASGTFSVRLELPNPEHTIPSGLHCQARFLHE
ncbi:MAG: efflux RND transporter periplasmic adaptor subunit [Deltaproteobacteria bacterium]|nr:MAG: efflux RND transporter periplasmic adaptor subunit [Deltaproteobacteria bacterium]